MTAVADTMPVSTFPPALALSLLVDGRNVAGVRAQLAATAAELSPRAADAAASDYAAAALRLIRDGHDEPERLARHTLAVCDVLEGRWAG